MPLADPTTQLKQEQDVFTITALMILMSQALVISGTIQMIPGYGYRTMVHDNLELAFVCFIWGGATFAFSEVVGRFSKWLIREEKKNG